MKNVESQHNDTRVLLAVAGFVVAGAAAIAVLAGLGARVDSPPSRKPTVARTSHAARTMPQPAPAIRVAESKIESPAPVAREEVVVAVVPEAQPTAEETSPQAEDSLPQIDVEANPIAAGLAAYGAREFDLAAAYFAADAEARPEVAWSSYMLGLSLWKAQRQDAAAEAMGRACALREDWGRAWINLARIENDRENYERAVDASARARAVAPEDAKSHLVHARSLLNLGRHDEAETAILASLETDPFDGYAHNLLGLIRIEQGRAAEALEPLRRAVRLQPSVAFVHNNLGVALERSGSPGDALAAFRSARDLDGSHLRAAASVARLESLGIVVEPPAVEFPTEIAEVETPTEPFEETSEVEQLADATIRKP